MKTKRHPRFYSLVIFGLFFLLIPSFNMIDIMPDCVAYFILAAVIGKSDDLVPYLAEAKSALTKLGFVTLARIPGMVIMYANMSSGRDIVILFTIVFNALETIFFLTAVSNGFNALYYIGERTEASQLIRPFRFCGIKIKAEKVKTVTIVFFVARALLNTLPAFCLITFSDMWNQYYARQLYPRMELSFMAISLLLGVLWFFFTRKYVRVIRKPRTLYSSIHDMVGEEKLLRVRAERKIRSKNAALLLLAIASLLSFDVTFRDFGNVNLLPHFIYGLVLVFIAWRLFDKQSHRIISSVFGGLYIVFGFLAHSASIYFFDHFSYDDIAEYYRGSYGYSEAMAAYNPIKVYTTLECLAFIGLAVIMAIGFIGFIKSHTVVDVSSERYGITEMKRHKKLSVMGVILFVLSALIQIGKCLNVYFHSIINIVFVSIQNPDGTYTADVVADPILPWFGILVFIMGIALVVYSFLYLTSLREEVKLKYSDIRFK